MQHERRENIKKMLDSEGVVNAQELAGRFGVSTETIRRDLEILEKDGLIRRVHGGAVSLRRHINESAYQSRIMEHTPEKRAIAAKVAELIDDGDTVLISPGTTTLEVATFLTSKKNLTVITNSLPIAIQLTENPDINVCCLGGRVRGEDYAATGILSLENLELYNADKLILGVGCVSPEKGVTDYRMEEALILRRFTEAAPCIIGVADSSKFGQEAGFRICPVEKLDCLVTDEGADAKTRKIYRKLGVELITVKVQE